MTVVTGAATIDQFLSTLEGLPEAGFASSLTDYISSICSIERSSLNPYAFFFPNRYTRNLIFKNELFEVMALCWSPGQVSNVHNHRDQQCWMLMAEGRLENQNYRVWDLDPIRRSCQIEPTSSLVADLGHPITVDMDEPVHQIRNLAEWNELAVSVHVYSRPFDTCEVYCPDRKTYADVKLSNWSEYGKQLRTNVADPCTEE